jgi:NTP pyrophosphatase (non-canonical NTP hydrolase)
MVNQLIKMAHTNAIKHGWWDEERTFGELIALMHSELSEALEEYRNGLAVNQIYFVCDMDCDLRRGDGNICRHKQCPHGISAKPCGIPIELADCIIRIFDTCGKHDIDLEAVIKMKMAYNMLRPNRHGGKVL